MRDAYTHLFMRKKHWMKKPLGASLTDVSERLRPGRMDKQTNKRTNMVPSNNKMYLHSDFLSSWCDTVPTSHKRCQLLWRFETRSHLQNSMSSRRFFNPFLHISGEKEILAAACLRKGLRLLRVDGQSAYK